MKSYLLLVLFIISGINAFAHREETYYIIGTLHNKEIVIQLEEYGDVCMARYITEDNMYDKSMEGTILRNGHFVLTASYFNSETNQKVVTDSVSLQEVKTDQWEGSWKDKNGNISDFKLKRLEVEDLNHPCISAIKKYRITPYLAYKTRHIQFDTLKTEKISKHVYVQYLTEPNSDITLFRVKAHKKGILEVDSINTWLESQHLNAINMKYSCVIQGKKGNYSIGFDIFFLDNELISYQTITSASCYGVPEADKKELFNLQMRNAEPIFFEDLYWFGENPQTNLTQGEYKWFQYRYKVFGPKVLDLLNQIHPREMNTKREDGFSYNNVKIWQFPEWHLTPKGVYLGYKSPGTARKNDSTPWSIIPYKKLKSYQTKKFNLGM
ncbi:hypothetical protein [Carboxylicivirga linearis]|uniref:YARHG domain-containing protein n=1 Tax=Carboxylicivirga linearis TaxID=1628157 RepID=A0ABS5JZK5_9BACT|nr:hypothetical protein [Carboxylicivirga linearis]MBS2100335.1 hypothetical protein [Carboxylicivirga linearis]